MEHVVFKKGHVRILIINEIFLSSSYFEDTIPVPSVSKSVYNRAFTGSLMTVKAIMLKLVGLHETNWLKLL